MTDRRLFPVGHDAYQDDFVAVQDNFELDVDDRLVDITKVQGVSRGLVPSDGSTGGVGKVAITAGLAYQLTTGLRIKTTGTLTINVTSANNGQYVVLRSSPVQSLSSTHRVTGATANRAQDSMGILALTGAPLATDVRLCLVVTVTSTTGPVTLNAVSPDNRDVLTLGAIGGFGGSGNTAFAPFIVVAKDGSGNFTTIQDAVNAVQAAGGGDVYVKAGDYDELVTLTATPSLKLVGGATGQVRLRALGTSAPCISITGACQNILIEHITLFSDTPGAGSAFVMMDNTSSQNVTVRDCVFASSGLGVRRDHAVQVSSNGINMPQGVLVENCRTLDGAYPLNGAFKIACPAATLPDIKHRNYTFRGNVLGTLSAGSGSAPVYVDLGASQKSFDILVESNRFICSEDPGVYGDGRVAMTLTGAGDFPNNNRVRVLHNEFINMQTTLISLPGAWVVNNVFTCTTGGGSSGNGMVTIDAGAHRVRFDGNRILYDNTGAFGGVAIGIDLSDADDVSVQGNQILFTAPSPATANANSIGMRWGIFSPSHLAHNRGRVNGNEILNFRTGILYYGGSSNRDLGVGNNILSVGSAAVGFSAGLGTPGAGYLFDTTIANVAQP